jgi:hypothetical protein
MQTRVNRAYDDHDNRRHALSLGARTLCGLARSDVRSTTLEFDPTDFFSCAACVAAFEEPQGVLSRRLISRCWPVRRGGAGSR